MSFRGHGASDALVGGWDYDVLADDVRTVADHVGATNCVGLSLGGGALLRVLRDDPGRFERLAFVLPAALDSTRGDGATERLRLLGHAIDRGDADEATALLMAEVPAALRERRGVELLLRRRAADLVTRPAPVPRGEDRPLSDRSVLQQITAPTLVAGQEADPLHPIALARELSELLPNASLLELPEGGVPLAILLPGEGEGMATCLQRRAALASTLVAGLELTCEGELTLDQLAAFGEIRVSRPVSAGGHTSSAPVPVGGVAEPVQP